MQWNFNSVAIVGSGAIGLYYGGRLALAGEDVRFLLRSDFGEVSRQGLRVESVAGDFALPEVRGYRTAAEIGPVDLVIVSWKTTANGRLAEVLAPLLHEQTQVLTLQNGLGSCETIADLVGGERVLGGLCFVGINRLAPGFVKHTGGGLVTVGEWRPDGRERAETVARRLRRAKVPSERVGSLAKAQWSKLVWNIPFNGLAIAEGGVTTDVLLRSKGVEREIRLLMAEVIAAARAQGLELKDELIDWNIGRTRTMGAYRPSSMIDYVEGRAVELESIWEEPLRRAKAAKVPMPRLERLRERIVDRLRAREDSGT